MKKTLLFVTFLLLISIFYPHSSVAQVQLWGLASGGGSQNQGTIFKINTDGTCYSYTSLENLTEGATPEGSLIQLANGKFYGTTMAGGAIVQFGYMGVLFEYSPQTKTYKKLVEFNSTNGSRPTGRMTLANNGKLYGMTMGGGSNDIGVIFEYDVMTGNYLKKFDFTTSSGSSPFGSLVLASNNKLYGMTHMGGENGRGTLFEFNPTDGSFTKKFDFGSLGGTNPYGDLIQASNGKLYGMTAYGGTENQGVIFEFDLSNNTFSKKIDFKSNLTGSYPFGGLMQSSTNSKLYGMTRYGGLNNNGVLFEFDLVTGNIMNKFNFEEATSGTEPRGSLVETPDGKLYGMASLGGKNGVGTLIEYDISSATVIKKHDFSFLSGGEPNGSLIISMGTKLDQTITFNSLPSKKVGDVPFTLNASTTSGLPLMYSSSDTTIAKISGSIVTILKEGTITITSSQAGDCLYNATSSSQLLTIAALPTTSNCFAYRVYNFKQGKTKLGKVIEAIRSNPQQALGAPQDNDTYNFVSLGFEGSITLELDQPLYNTNGYDPDFILVETSFGRADEKCFKGGNTFSYPETSVIEVSDGSRWRSLPNSYCRTSFIDISSVIDNTFKYVKLIRIKDFSNKTYFDNNADGFDVDGLIVCPAEVVNAFKKYTNGRTAGTSDNQWNPAFFNYAPNEAAEEVHGLKISPNPASTSLTFEFHSSTDQTVEIGVYDFTGRQSMTLSKKASEGSNTYELDVAKLSSGPYLIKVLSREGIVVEKFIKFQQ